MSNVVVVNAPGWEEVADYALTWAIENAVAKASVSAV
jgi:hypothetical protein